jgi:hypothetical protein
MQPDLTPPVSSSEHTGPYALLEKELAPLFLDRLPPVSVGVKEGFVKYFPWITLVLMVLLLPVVILAFGLGAVLSPLSFLGGLGSGVFYIISVGLTGLVLVLDLLALNGLFNRKRRGWVLAYYAQLVSIVSSILSFSIFSILLAAGFMYLLFQVRSYYK